jgi:multiple sugar transport system substrate-binding protein
MSAQQRSRRWLLGRAGAWAGLAGAATACGSSGGGPAPGGTPAAAHPPVTLTIWENPRFRWKEDVGKEITDPLLAASPWLRLETSVPTGDAREKFLAAASAGTPPDSYSNGSYWAQQDLVDGVTGSLERYLAASRQVQRNDLWASLRRDVEFKGHLTAMPYAPDTRIVFTHVENAHAAGLDPGKAPATWSEMAAQVHQAFRGSGPGIDKLAWHPFTGSGGVYLWMVPYWQLGGETITADETRITFFNDQAVEALTWLKQLVDLQGGWAAAEAYRKNYSAPNGEQIFMEGGFTFLHATLSERSEQFKIKTPNLSFNISSYPLPDKGGAVANYGGCHTLCIAKGGKNPDVTWQFIEYVTNNENNIKFALRFDRVPIRESSTASPAYIQGDKGRGLQAQEMKKRRFVIAAPGGNDMLPLQDVVTPFMSGQSSLQDALKEKERLCQEVLDKYRVKADAVRP